MKKYQYILFAVFCTSSVQAMNIQEEKKEIMEKMPIIYGSNLNYDEHVIDINIKPIDYNEYILLERRKSDASKQEKMRQESESNEFVSDIGTCCVGVVGCGIITVLLVISKVYS